MVRGIGTWISGFVATAARAVRLAGRTVASTAERAVRVVRATARTVGSRSRQKISRTRSGIATWVGRTSRHRATWYASAAVVVVVVIVLLLVRSGGERPLPAARVGQGTTVPTPGEPSFGSPESIVIPSLVGMTAFDAHERLAQVGLVVDSAQPVPGTPGIVIRTYPDPGVHVAPGTAVTLFVGAPPGRLQDSG
jgi:PASTA domain